MVLIFALLVLCQCEKQPQYDDEVPKCIVDKIEEFKQGVTSCDGNQVGPNVISYNFQGEVVYVFSQGQCVADGGAQVVDEECEELCNLGTILGLVECRGENFADNAVQIEVLWQD